MKGQTVIPRRSNGFEVAHRVEDGDHHFEVAIGSSFNELYWDVPAKRFVADRQRYEDLPQILEAEGEAWLVQLLTSLGMASDHWPASFDEMLLKGVVDQVMFDRFADAHGYDAASSIGWLRGKLAILSNQVRNGRHLALYAPAGQIDASTQDEFQHWANKHFPSA